MSNSKDVRVVDVRVEFEPVPFRAPLKFGGRTVTQTELINVTVDVESAGGGRASGFGSMPVGNVWSWPSNSVSADDAERAMKRLAEISAVAFAETGQAGHPVDLMVPHYRRYDALALQATQEVGVVERMPKLSQLVANSPLDAAVHDAYGKVHRVSAYNALSATYMNHDLATYLGDEFAGEYLDAYTLRAPRPTMPLYHLVGALDPLTDAELDTRIDDGLPETLGEWIVADGLTHLKIKLSGDDLHWDVQRVAAVESVASIAQHNRGCRAWSYSLDFNEKCANVDYVLDFLGGIEAESPHALARVQYIEQPTHRDLARFPENKMHRAASIKPVVIDESLVDLESLDLAQELGYTGVAFKACKGHTESLLLAAAAIKRNLFLCVQDLTCPGYSFLHSASLAARIPGIAAIEGNGRQYCPAPNAAFASAYPGMFEFADGTVQTGELRGAGLF